jgi:hypothetical protein
VADKLGIDLIWFGVLLGVNMQTSFMHPPFGFALFYLRSVAPAKDFLDKITGRLTKRVTTGQIYWGAVPFVLIQIVMIALVISFPQMVMVYKAKERVYDINKIQIVVPEDESAQGGRPTEANPNVEQDEAQKALEKELGATSAAPGTITPPAPTSQPPSSSTNTEQDEATKALEKALGGPKAPEGKAGK